MALRILVDTNVLLDYLLEREPYEKSAAEVIRACKSGYINGCIAAHSVSNMFFILRKMYSSEERRGILKDICRLFEVEGIDKSKVIAALDNDAFKDFEDCLQMECAKSFHADYIVSRNLDDFKTSSIPCVTPDQLCSFIGDK